MPRSRAGVHRKRRVAHRSRRAGKPARGLRKSKRADDHVRRVQAAAPVRVGARRSRQRRKQTHRRVVLGRPCGHPGRAGQGTVPQPPGDEQPGRGRGRRQGPSIQLRSAVSFAIRGRGIRRRGCRLRSDRRGNRGVRANVALPTVLLEVRRLLAGQSRPRCARGPRLRAVQGRGERQLHRVPRRPDRLEAAHRLAVHRLQLRRARDAAKSSHP